MNYLKQKQGELLMGKFTDGVEVLIKNKKVRWASVHEPDTKYEPCFKVDLIFDKVVDADEIKFMQDQGYNMKEYKDEPDIMYLRAKSKTTTKAGKANRPPRVLSRDGSTPFTEDIGNGSECNVKIFVKEVVVSGVTHVATYLNAVQVVDHVAFGGAGFDDLTSEGENFNDF